MMREHIERVVRDAYQAEMVAMGFGASGPQARIIDNFSAAIARRVADRLSVPVLSEEECEALDAVRENLEAWDDDADDVKATAIRVIDRFRLIAAGKP